MMMNELFALTEKGGICTQEMINIAEKNVIFSQESSYQELLANLSSKQKQVLQAIAREGTVQGITSSAFIHKHRLPSASSVQSAIKPLLANDIITVTDNSYRIYDYFFSHWLSAQW